MQIISIISIYIVRIVCHVSIYIVQIIRVRYFQLLVIFGTNYLYY